MKQIKVLGVIAIALTLGLTACGKKAECKKHTWGDYVTVTEATCTTDGSQKRTCSVCGKEETKVIKAGHKYGDWSVVTPSTCETAGSQQRTCSACGNVDTQALPLAAHTYPQDADGNDIVAWNPEATCTEAGSGTKTCSVCGHEEAVTQNALGHNYHKDAQGNIEFNWTKAPTCTEAGVGKKHCDRCNLDFDATDDERKALGHDTELIGGAEEAPAGEATVRVWRCKRCGDEFLGFKATEVTAASKQRLVFTPAEPTEGQEQSARFFGHPIGNDVPLNDQGDPDQNNHPSIYNKNQTGDYFEYVFTLNAAQAAKLATVRCYCDAKPAQYLGANGIDFWANKSGDEDWTRGMYIDDNPDHYEVDDQGQPVMVDEIGPDGQPTGQQIQKGKEITDYRYVLYVDDQIQEFDEDTKVSVPNGDPRGEYVMPYTFHLKEGRNKISLRMAGGYRSEFYSFVFRPYEEPEQVVVNQTSLEMKVDETAQITSSMTGLTYASADTSIATVDSTGLVKGVKAGTTQISVSKEGNYKPAKVAVKINEKDGVYQVEVETGTSSKGEDGADQVTFRNASGGHNSTDAFPKDAVLTLPFQVATAGTYTLKICGRRSYNSDDEFDNKFTSAFEMKLNNNALETETAVSGNSWAEYNIGDFEFQAGANELTFKALRETNPINLDYIRIEPPKEVPADPWVLDSETVMPTPAADEAIVKRYVNSVEEGKVKYEIEAKTGNFALTDGSQWKNNPSTGAFKLDKTTSSQEGSEFTFKFALPKAFEGQVYQYGYMDGGSSNASKKIYYDTGSANIQLKLNNSVVPIDASMAEKKFSDVLDYSAGGSNSAEGLVLIGNCVLGTQNTGSYKRLASLNMIISKLVFIGEDHVHGNWQDGTPVAAGEGTSGYTPGTCACGANRLNFDLSTSTTGNISVGAKIDKSNKTATFVFPMDADVANAEVWVKISVDVAANIDYGFHTGKNGGNSAVTPLPDGKTNTVVKMNGTTLTLPDENVKYSDLGVKGVGEANAGTAKIASCSLQSGNNTLTFTCQESFAPNYWEIFIVY